MSERMTIECACERGGRRLGITDCTSISACSADSMLEDQADSYEDRIAELEATIEEYKMFADQVCSGDVGNQILLMRLHDNLKALADKPEESE